MQTAEEIKAQIGAKMKAIRKAKKITLDGIEQLTGINRANLSRLERGKLNPTVVTLTRIADALSTPVAQFFN